MTNVLTRRTAVRLTIFVLVALTVYLALGFALGSWLWLGVGDIGVALFCTVADRLIRAAWGNAPPREPIRLPPI